MCVTVVAVCLCYCGFVHQVIYCVSQFSGVLCFICSIFLLVSIRLDIVSVNSVFQ